MTYRILLFLVSIVLIYCKSGIACDGENLCEEINCPTRIKRLALLEDEAYNNPTNIDTSNLNPLLQTPFEAKESKNKERTTEKFRYCNGCHEIFVTKLQCCSRCKHVYYCSRQCQAEDWKRGHKKKCTPKTGKQSPAFALKEQNSKNMMYTTLFSSNFAISSAPSRKPTLSSQQKKFRKKFLQLPLGDILDRGPVQNTCNEIGQEIFDFFKKNNDGDSLLAFQSLQAIVQAVFFDKKHGPLRMQRIEQALNGVGDTERRWMP